jgi:hypothetical protein
MICLLPASCLFNLLFDPEDWVSTFLRNAYKLLPDCSALHPTRICDVFLHYRNTWFRWVTPVMLQVFMAGVVPWFASWPGVKEYEEGSLKNSVTSTTSIRPNQRLVSSETPVFWLFSNPFATWLHSVQWYGGRRIAKDLDGSCRGIIEALSCNLPRGAEKNTKTRIVDVPAEIRTEHLPNAILERWR